MPFRTTHLTSPVPPQEPGVSPAHAEPPATQTGTARDTTHQQAESRTPAAANLPPVRAPAPSTLASATRPAISRASAWRDDYALTRVPREYASTDTTGVLRDLDSGQTFILHGGRAYAVARNQARETVRLAVPDDRSRMGSAVTRDASGEWKADDDARAPDTGRASSVRATDRSGALPGRLIQRDDPHSIERRTARYILTHARATTDELVANMHVPWEIVEKVAADVDAVRHAWSHAVSREAPAAAATSSPLTPREQAFVGRWAHKMSAANFAGMMQWPLSKIRAYLQSDRHRDEAQASTSHEGSGSAPPRTGREGERLTGNRRGRILEPDRRERIIRRLRANPTMSYHAIADSCAAGLNTVAALAREHQLQRDRETRFGDARSALIDDFLLFPESTPSELAREHDVPRTEVIELRALFERIQRDWNAVRRADITDIRPELLASLSNRERLFIQQWGGTMSADNLSIVTRSPEAAIEAYMRSDEYSNRVRDPPPVFVLPMPAQPH
ncbi:hypothetical protein [Paraburkholderia humisilvae]|uniref:Uncharacterized protein n=1 Tax=Paraburkholderia humisilvae TaxID=627669 RepID=A0A6J5D930_9BURK|nr:hypothetical protein [Paraburkholderia humisilvae]CAB3749911.1 hypothetical protein LMG29542_01142 [Paraburkholderia humisilvae]